MHLDHRYPAHVARDITFSNLDVSFPGGGTAAEAARRIVPDLERDYPEFFIFGVLPAYGLYVHHAQGITLNNVRFHLEAEDLRPAVVCDDVQNLELTGLKADGSHKAESLIRLQDTQAALITGSRVLQPLKTFLRVEGGASQRDSPRRATTWTWPRRCFPSPKKCRRMRSGSTRPRAPSGPVSRFRGPRWASALWPEPVHPGRRLRLCLQSPRLPRIMIIRCPPSSRTRLRR